MLAGFSLMTALEQCFRMLGNSSGTTICSAQYILCSRTSAIIIQIIQLIIHPHSLFQHLTASNYIHSINIHSNYIHQLSVWGRQGYNNLLEMDESCCQILNKFVRDVAGRQYEKILKRAEEAYNVREFKISQINPALASQLYHSIYIKYVVQNYDRFKRNKDSKGELNWWENELRVFIWVVVCYLEINSRRIEDLGTPDWQFFSRLFPHKQIILFQYQSINLLKDHSAAKKWTEEEDQLFGSLIKYPHILSPRQKDQKYKWSQLAKQLYISSNKQFFRTPKQCRERWLNHLDPSKSKKQWQLKEDYVLITHVRNKGKKWAQISKLLRNRRNEHSIKNRFKSLLTKQEKLHQQQVPQSLLVQYIFKKYEHHFSRIKGVGISQSQSQQVKYQAEDEQDYGQDRYGAENDNNANVMPSSGYPIAISKPHLFQIHSNPNFPSHPNQQHQRQATQQQQIDPLQEQIRFAHQQSDEDQYDEDNEQYHMFQEENQREASHYQQMHSQQKQYQFLIAKERQIRSQFMMSDDPFIYLKDYFKCKDM